MIIDKSIYVFMNSAAKYLNLWILCFLVYTITRIVLKAQNPKSTIAYSTVASECAALPITLLHTVCFVKAVQSLDYISLMLFLWWGPGFLVTAAWYVYIKWRKIPFNWAPLGKITSWACKMDYVLFMGLYWYFGCYEIMMAFSVWIIHDQINLAWFANNADRTRRITEDYWVFRIGYIGFLFTPLFVGNFSYRVESIMLGSILFLLWCASVLKVIKSGNFYYVPSSKDFLRNIVYFKT